MPARTQRPDDKHWCGLWPVTIRRIENFQLAFKGAPSRRVPFGLHAIKYLRAMLDEACRRGGFSIDEIEAAVGMGDPDDAPWIERPRSDGAWHRRVGGESEPIPYRESDQGTDDHPSFEQYEEHRHEAGRPLTTGERRDEQQLARREAETMDLSCLDAPAGGVDPAEVAAEALAASHPSNAMDEDEEAMSAFF